MLYPLTLLANDCPNMSGISRVGDLTITCDSAAIEHRTHNVGRPNYCTTGGPGMKRFFSGSHTHLVLLIILS
jgi:hypothetical protein